MNITICGSIKFINQMRGTRLELEKFGHRVFLPQETRENIDYSNNDRSAIINAKKKYDFIREHMDKIERSDAILVMNLTKGDIKHYIGANTFLEMGFAYYNRKKIFLLNQISKQVYIMDEIKTFEPVVINGDYSKI